MSRLLFPLAMTASEKRILLLERRIENLERIAAGKTCLTCRSSTEAEGVRLLCSNRCQRQAKSDAPSRAPRHLRTTLCAVLASLQPSTADECHA